jgi:uncharacterized protein
MIWSRYNTLFHSGRLGYFLFNALSNTLLEVDEAHYGMLDRLRDGGAESGSVDPGFLSILREHKAILSEGEEKLLLLTLRYQRNTHCFDNSRLSLTICPTLACNFRCSYCFERTQQESAVMSHATVERLIRFIESYKEIRHLALAWYGGEPLIGFKAIREVTERLKRLSIDFQGAALVTNGYLLDKDKCESLNDLKIHSLQITLDGPERLHDKRRVLAGGGPTFQHILTNIDTLMKSSFSGSCHIRVNLDKHNREAFPELHALLQERYKGKKLSIYAAPVHASAGCAQHLSCGLNLEEWSELTFDTYRRSGLLPAGDFYPTGEIDSVCVGIAHNRFVIGPAGELYKCWEDVGKPAMIVGNIHQTEPITNPELRALYSIGTDAYNDPECVACAVLPICGGGCANKRLRAKHFGEKGLDYCSPYKKNLVGYLEGYIDRFLTKELCAALLSPVRAQTYRNGYRLISPEAPPHLQRPVDEDPGEAVP